MITPLFTYGIRALTVSIMLITCLYGFSHKDSLSETQAKKYIGHLVDTLFMPTNHSGTYERQLKKFTEEVTRLLIKRLGKYQSPFAFSKVYFAQEIDEALMGEAVLFIEQLCTTYAQDNLKKFFVPAGVNKHNLVNRTVAKIRNEVLDIITASSFLEPGVLTNFFGAPLNDKVYHLLKKELEQAQAHVQSAKPVQYPTPECPVCYEYFNTHHKRLFLSCGHNMCGSCLKEWYKQKGNNVTCPCCRAKIKNITELLKQASEPKTYPTPNCPVCLDTFNNSTKRLFLSCGHNLCVSCLREWYQAKGYAVSCPLCRTSINVTEFAHELWAPSAPPA